MADSSKIGKRGFAKIGDIASASDIVTDAGASTRGRRRARRLGPQVHVVDLP